MAICNGKIKGIVLSGCGFLIATHIGFLKAFEKYTQKKIKENEDLKQVIGVSAGSIIGFLWILGISLEDIYDFLSDFSVSDFIHPQLNDLFSKLGIHSFEPIIGYIKEFLDLHCVDLRHNITFKQLARRCRVNFIVVATDANTMQSVYFSAQTTPDMIVLDAIKASATIPLVFGMNKTNGVYLIDGCLSDPLPYEYLYSQHNIPKSNILVHSIKCLGNNTYKEVEGVGDLLSNLLLYLNKSLTHKAEQSYSESNSNNPFIIKTITEGYHPLSLNINKQDMFYLMELGTFNFNNQVQSQKNK